MEFHSPSEKIKLMRKRFGIQQNELEGVNMTRAFISMMESGKRNVSKSSSKMLAEKFNKVANMNSVELNLDDEYFSRTAKEDAIYYCKKGLKEELGHVELKDLIKISEDFYLDDILAELYKMDGHKYYEEEDYKEAFLVFRKALGKFKELKDNEAQSKLYHLLGNCKSISEEYEDAAEYYQEAMAYAFNVKDMDTYYRVAVNLAVIYMKAKLFEKSLEVLDKYILNKADEINKEIVANALVTKGLIWYWSDKYDDAINEFLKLEHIEEEIDELKMAMAYNNLAECYYKIGDYEKSLKYADEAQRIKTRINKRTLPQTLNTKGKVLFKKGFYNESILILNLAIDISEEYKQFNYLLENYKDLVEVYESQKEYESIRDLMNKLLKTSEFYGIRRGKSYAVLKLAEISVNVNNKCDTVRFLNKLESLLQ